MCDSSVTGEGDSVTGEGERGEGDSVTVASPPSHSPAEEMAWSRLSALAQILPVKPGNQ